MKAISLWQPWASLISTGAKQIETRSYKTNVRGRIAIHAARKFQLGDLQEVILRTRPFQDGLASLARPNAKVNLFDLPFGKIVATCELVACLPADDRDLLLRMRPVEIEFGDFSVGRWAWMLADIVRLPEPVPCLGRQGWFNVYL